jgi:peptidoglycan/LPS O-acetylase OafA/YrhL
MERSDKNHNWLPRILTIPCFLFTAFLLYFFYWIEKDEPFLDNIGALLPLVILLISIIVSWIKEHLGGMLILVSLLFLAIDDYALHNWLIQWIIISILLGLAGIIFIARNSKKKDLIIVVLSIVVIFIIALEIYNVNKYH